MRYLTLSADYRASPLRDDLGAEVELTSTEITDALQSRLRAWSEAYQEIIPLGMKERGASAVQARIEPLDAEGLRLAQELVKAIPGGAKVRYFSEGLLRHLD